MNLVEIPDRYRKYRVIPLLLAIFLLGFAIRYLAAGPRIGPELDTWFHYRMVNYILDTGSIPKIDPLAYYPTGRPVYETDLLGLPNFIAYTFKMIRFTGITVMDYMVAFPAIFTSLAAIPLYLLTKEILNSKTGLLAALLWQIIPSTLTRTHAGFVDKESLASIYIFIWLWLFVRSIRTFELNKRRTFLTPILAGIFMGFSEWTWGGSGYFVLVISASIFLYTLHNFRRPTENVGFALILMVVFDILTILIVQAPRYPISRYYTSFIYAGLIVLSVIYGFYILYPRLTVRMGEKNSQYTLASIAILILGGAGISGHLQRFISGIFGFARSRIFLEKSLVAATVSENLAPRFLGGGNSILTRIFNGDWYSHFNLVLFVAPIGLILLLRSYTQRKDYPSLLLFVLMLGGIFGMRSDIRLSFVLTIPMAILTAYTVVYFIDSFKNREENLVKVLATSKKQKIRYKAETNLSNTKLASLLVLVIIFGIIASPTVSSFSMLDGRRVDVPTPWYEAMVWIRDNTPEDAIIVSWWDYGYWEQGLAKRRTVVDGGNAGPLLYNSSHTLGLEYRGDDFHRDVDMAKMFTSPENEALKYLRPYVDYEKVPTYVIVSYEEFGKSGAINHIARDGLYFYPQTFQKSGDIEKDSETINGFVNSNGIEAYTVIDFGGHWQLWATGFEPNSGPNPEMKNKLLPKLLPISTGLGQGLEHFELVYQDKWNYVLIYKII
jgi:dolichyl-diphosphooligosaccharide--protein glycosyltransferase